MLFRSGGGEDEAGPHLTSGPLQPPTPFLLHTAHSASTRSLSAQWPSGVPGFPSAPKSPPWPPRPLSVPIRLRSRQLSDLNQRPSALHSRALLSLGPKTPAQTSPACSFVSSPHPTRLPADRSQTPGHPPRRPLSPPYSSAGPRLRRGPPTPTLVLPNSASQTQVLVPSRLQPRPLSPGAHPRPASPPPTLLNSPVCPRPVKLHREAEEGARGPREHCWGLRV